MLNVPFFYSVSRPLDLFKANKSPGDKTTKKRNKKTENVINSDFDSWTKGGLGKHNKRTDKRREVENGFRQ